MGRAYVVGYWVGVASIVVLYVLWRVLREWYFLEEWDVMSAEVIRAMREDGTI